MTLARSHRFGCVVQALFCLDHAPAGEAVSAVRILAEFDQFGRARNSIHHRIEPSGRHDPEQEKVDLTDPNQRSLLV
jgi:hypothetical protein